MKRRPQNIGGQGITSIAFVTMTSNAPVTFGGTPTFSISLPFGAASFGPFSYVALYDPTNPQLGWTTFEGPGTASGNTLTFPGSANPSTQLKTGITYDFVIFTVTSMLPTPTPTPTMSPTPTPTPTPTAMPGPGTPLTGPALGPNGGWGPPAVANALDFPVQSGFDGSGFTIAIVTDSNIYANDYTKYLSDFQIPQTGRQIQYTLVDGSATPKNDVGEVTLDVETVAGLAPGANILLYVIKDLNAQSETNAYNQIINDHIALIASSSFSGCETIAGLSQTGESTVFQSGANNKVAFVASSGDRGNDCFAGYDSFGRSLYQPGVEYPASDPNVIAVGGTETNRPQFTLTSTIAWNDANTRDGSRVATGGGVSQIFSIPSYQQGVPGVASTQFRNVPDIAMPASYVYIYLNAAPDLRAGTSWSAPLFAAMLSETYQYCRGAFYGAVGLPYYVFQRARYSAFIDVVSGNNAVDNAGPYYAAQPGFDNSTGIGVPLGMPFARTLCPNRVFASGLPSERSPAAAHRSAQAFHADVVPKVRGLIDRGRRAHDERTHIQLVLRPTATLASDERTVIETLRTSGFTITRTFENHLVINAEAATYAVEQLFSTEIHNVNQGKFGMRFMPVGPAIIPATLAPYISGLTLDDVVTMASRH